MVKDTKSGISYKIGKIRAPSIYKNAEFYDLIYSGNEGDESYYIKKALRGRVLYLGIGTGRIFSKILRNNSKVVGVDNSIAMLKLMQKKYPMIAENHVIIRDVLEIEFPSASFDSILAPYSFFNFFKTKEVNQLLTKMSCWLSVGGAVFTDFFSPFKNPPFNQPSEIITTQAGEGTLRTEITYDHINQQLSEYSIIMKEGKRPSAVLLHQYYYYPNEILRLFQKNNLTVEIRGGFRGEKLSVNHDPIVVTAKKNV